VFPPRTVTVTVTSACLGWTGLGGGFKAAAGWGFGDLVGGRAGLVEGVGVSGPHAGLGFRIPSGSRCSCFCSLARLPCFGLLLWGILHLRALPLSSVPARGMADAVLYECTLRGLFKTALGLVMLEIPSSCSCACAAGECEQQAASSNTPPLPIGTSSALLSAGREAGQCDGATVRRDCWVLYVVVSKVSHALPRPSAQAGVRVSGVKLLMMKKKKMRIYPDV
jgi:hypothetical protein